MYGNVKNWITFSFSLCQFSSVQLSGFTHHETFETFSTRHCGWQRGIARPASSGGSAGVWRVPCKGFGWHAPQTCIVHYGAVEGRSWSSQNGRSDSASSTCANQQVPEKHSWRAQNCETRRTGFAWISYHGNHDTNDTACHPRPQRHDTRADSATRPTDSCQTSQTAGSHAACRIACCCSNMQPCNMTNLIQYNLT